MATLILRYRPRAGGPRAIALTGRLVVDLAARGPAYVVAELAAGEGDPQIQAVLRGEGGYLERAQTGERLCRIARPDELARKPDVAEAA